MARVESDRTQARGLNRVRGYLHPKVLVLVGLAIAIVCWGVGYRLSGYQLGPTSVAHTGAAKLCVEPRNSALAAASQLNVVPPTAEVLPVAPAELRPLHRETGGLLYVFSPDNYRSAAFDFLIPFRSPPPQPFLA